MQPPPPPTFTTIRVYSATRKDADGHDVVQGEMRMIDGRLIATGGAVGMVGAARNRLWDDATIMRFYERWSNGYIWTAVVD